MPVPMLPAPPEPPPIPETPEKNLENSEHAREGGEASAQARAAARQEIENAPPIDWRQYLVGRLFRQLADQARRTRTPAEESLLRRLRGDVKRYANQGKSK